MDKLYLLPIQRIIDDIGDERGPKYIKWRDVGELDPGDNIVIVEGLEGYRWSMMDYGFADFGLVLIMDISQVDHVALVLNADVYEWPALDALDVSIDPQDNLDVFFENIGIPTDWLNPANTYLEFLRQTAAMFQFNQSYAGIAAQQSGTTHDLLVDSGGLNVRYNSWDQNIQDWFDATLVKLNYPPIQGNPSLRQLMKSAGNLWGNKPFVIGGFEF
jgi:hypothetical protein